MQKKYLVVSMMLAATSVSWGASGTAKMMELREGTAENQKISGTVSFEDTAQGLKVSARLENVPAGKHGFHIHEYGSCENKGEAAGSHYNPSGHPHGHVVDAGVAAVHAGDLGNITAGKDGKASIDAVIAGVSLSGSDKPVAGRAVILHEKVDDFGQPTGNAGGRIACGTIVLVK